MAILMANINTLVFLKEYFYSHSMIFLQGYGPLSDRQKYFQWLKQLCLKMIQYIPQIANFNRENEAKHG